MERLGVGGERGASEKMKSEGEGKLHEKMRSEGGVEMTR